MMTEEPERLMLFTLFLILLVAKLIFIFLLDLSLMFILLMELLLRKVLVMSSALRLVYLLQLLREQEQIVLFRLFLREQMVVM